VNHVNALLAARYGQTASRPTSLTKRPSVSSIEVSVSNTSNSIELPAEIDALIDNKAYRPRYRKLWRLHPRELMAWAQVARNQKQPSHYFAKGCAVAAWDRTLKFLAKLFKVQETAARVAQKLSTGVTKFIYRQIWRGVNVERWADTAAEVGRHKGKYFAWLCKREHAVS
jgi:hypothetical protein